MAKIVGEVAIDVTADVGPLARQMKKAEGAFSGVESRAVRMGRALGSALGISVVSAGAAATAMIALARASMQNIDAQAKLAQSLGTTVSSMQTLKRAGELAGVSMGGIQQATGDLTRRLSQAASGTGPVADALARLNLTAAALAKVPLDERVMQINEALDKFIPTTERAAVAGQLFGEEGSLAMARIDTATLRQATEDVHRFGVVVSEQDADQVEATNDAMTRLGLVVEGLGNRLAVSLAPAMEGTANALVTFAANVMGMRIELEQFFGTLENARNMLGEDVFNRLLGNPAEIANHAQAIDELAQSFLPVGDAARMAVPELRAVADMLDYVGEIGAADVLNRITDEMEGLVVEFAQGKVDAEEFAKKMEVLAARANGVITEMQGIDGVDFSGVVGRIGALTGALSSAWAMAKNLRAALPGGSGEMTMAPDGGGLTSESGDLLPPSPFAPTSSPRPQRQSVDTYGNWVEAARGTGGGGGGGGGGDKMSARITALVESLKTEQEILAAWYEESLATLNAASEAELLAVGGKHEALERLEEEHQKRLSEIQGTSQQQRLGEVAGFFGALASVTAAGGGKLAKATATFAAIEGTINAYRAALQALADPTLGFFGKFAAYASVLAAGLKGVAAIKGSGGGGGSAGASRGGASAAAPAAQSPTTTFQFTMTNDPFGFGESFARQFIDQLNQTQRNGGQIRGVIA